MNTVKLLEREMDETQQDKGCEKLRLYHLHKK